MDNLEEALPADERRSASRAHLSFRISIRERGRNQQEAIISNLSPFGCAAMGVFLVAEQQTVWVRLPGLESQAANIRWAKDGSAGFAFDHPLHPMVLARFVESRVSDGQVRRQRSASGLRPAEASSSRKDQILTGWADPSEQVLAKKQPLRDGKVLLGLIKRRTTRVADHRRERRYPLPTDAMGNVNIVDDRAKILNLSASGLQVEFAKRVEIGSSLPVTFEGFAGLTGQVVWARDEHVGLALPSNSINLREIPQDESEPETRH